MWDFSIDRALAQMARIAPLILLRIALFGGIAVTCAVLVLRKFETLKERAAHWMGGGSTPEAPSSRLTAAPLP